MTTRVAFWLLFAALLGSAVAAQVDNCSDCHISRPDAPQPDHVSDWQRSLHSRASVGCHDCHGGNTESFEPFAAHEGVVASSVPASPTHRTHLVGTCGRCHAGQLVEFRKSRHFELLEEGDGPTCITCHGSAGSHLFSPRGLERRCGRCHGEDRVGGHPEFPGLARSVHERIIEVRELLRTSGRLIRHVADDSRREALEQRVAQAEVPLREAVHAGHSFSFEGVEERLDVALARAQALTEELVNPSSDPLRQERSRP